ncbi:MAG: RecQ family ATP-dependent DNA helicase [Acidimicrobiia bacterium]
MRDHATALLHAIAGPDAGFRDGQWEAIEEIANGGRALVVQRTGWGKSAVYLIATRLLRDKGAGPTVIVSPLLALMRNQLEMAARMDLRATTVNSTNREEWDEIFVQIRNGEIDLLLISPERLNNQSFLRDAFPRLSASMGLLVVDEAHCISDWGHDFRPDYRRLSRLVTALPATVPILATTATANDRVVRDVADQLGSDIGVFRGPLGRESLALQVIRMPNKADRLAWLAATLPTLPGAGIVYCLTIKDAHRVGLWLRDHGIQARVYTGGTDSDLRLDIEDELSRGTLRTVVATSALGMGYDNPHIHYVIHFQSPGSPVAYYQQVGRAGRAVDRSFGVLLSGAEDREIQDYFINTAFPGEELTRKVLDALTGSELKLTDLEQVVNLSRSRLTGMLKVLEVEEAVGRERGTWFRSGSEWEYPKERVESVVAERRRERDAMTDYIATDQCLMEFLRAQLDDPQAAPCGRCANCIGEPVVATDIPEDLRREALEFLRRSHLPLEPRQMWPAGSGLASLRKEGSEEGRILALWGDPGWAELIRTAVNGNTAFADELVEATAHMIEQWKPEPVPTWVTAVPNAAGTVSDFAEHLAGRLGLEFVPAVTRVRERRKQRTMQNSAQQFRNVHGAFAVNGNRPGPVLLVDDMVDSRWTLTMVGHLLRQAGTEAVLPVALADTSQRSG